jgi:hypothetical protein
VNLYTGQVEYVRVSHSILRHLPIPKLLWSREVTCDGCWRRR